MKSNTIALAEELEDLIKGFEIEELEERLEFGGPPGWDWGSGCSGGIVCYNF